MSFVAPPGVPSQPIRVPWAASKSGRILGSIFRTQKRPQKCEPQLLRFTLLGPFLRPENGRKIGPALWPERGPGMESPCALLSLLQDMLPDVFRVRLPLSACLSFRVPTERPLSALLALLHVPFISLPCGMVPALSALSGGHEDLLHPVSNLGLQAWKTARLLPGKAPVCLGLRPECAERLGVHQRGSLARARHSA